MTVRKIGKTWRVDITTPTKRFRLKSPNNTRQDAIDYEVTLRKKLSRGESLERSRTVIPEQTFEQFAWQWFEEYVVSNNKPREQRSKKYTLRGSLVPFFGKMKISDITTRDIERYKVASLKEGLSRKTVNNRLTMLRKCLTTAYDWLELTQAQPKFEWLRCPPPKTDYLSPAECALLLAHSTGTLREMILMALSTGMRQGEIRGLQWSSVDWQNRSITVRHSQCDYPRILGSTKSNRERHIPIDAEVYTILFNRKKDTGYVFLNAAGRPFYSTNVERMLASVCEVAGLRRVGWHVLRHTFASHLAMRGVPLNAVQTLLGHSTINMTMRYAHCAPSTLRAAIDMLNPATAIPADFGQPVGNAWMEAMPRTSKNP